MDQITVQESRAKHRRLSSLVQEGKFNDLPEVYSLGADLILLVNKAIKTANPRYFDLEVLGGLVRECLKTIKNKDFSKTSRRLKELSLALQFRALIGPSMGDSRQTYLNLSEVFGKYSDELRNLATYDYRMKRTILRDLKMQLSALNVFFNENSRSLGFPTSLGENAVPVSQQIKYLPKQVIFNNNISSASVSGVPSATYRHVPLST